VNIVHASIRSPVTTAVLVIVVSLFGAIALFQLPIQLTPNVETPVITVETWWAGRSPQEIEREIVEEQEEQLKSVEGLVKMESGSEDSHGWIRLTFGVGADKDAALLKVSTLLDQVQEHPQDAEKPVIRGANSNANAMAWFALHPTEENGFKGDISTLHDFADDFIKPALERVPGIASSSVFGGREREMHVIVDPAKLAARRVTLNELAEALERENRNYSGGDFDEGKRRYVVRTVGEYDSPEEIENVVIAVRNDVPIRLRDVARAELGYRRARGRAYHFDEQVLFMNASKQAGTNSMQVMASLKEAVKDLNQGLLRDRGLQLTQDWDETVYIRNAVALVRDNVYVGSLLSILFLLIFLRSVSSTLIIATAIPISILGTFPLMLWMGRTLNVISLAGMAFASGIVVDNATVVLENIYRHRQLGKSKTNAAIDGTLEVWGAVLANTLATIVVFLPVVFIREEIGQLFSDIAIAIGFSTALSLLVSITVIPCLSSRILESASGHEDRPGFHNLWGRLKDARGAGAQITRTVRWITEKPRRSLAVVAVLSGMSIGLSLLLMPKREYLPTGNVNFLFGQLLPPPGYNLDELTSLHEVYKKELSHLWRHPKGSPEARALPGEGVEDFFFVAFNQFAFMGASSNKPMGARELLPDFQRANAQIPGAIAFIDQPSIFQSGFDAGRAIDVEITGPDLERLIELGREVFGGVLGALPGAQAFPIPSLDLANPEVRVTIHRQRAAELGISNRDLGFAVQALVDGAKVSDYQHEGREIDLKLMAEKGFAHRTHLLEQMPIATPDGRLVTLGAVAEVELASGPVEIHHRERQRTITIRVSPDEKVPLEAAMETLQAKVVQPMREAGKFGGLYQVTFSGTADKLVQAGNALRWNFLLALVITYLMIAALFESFLYPFVIMFSVPLAALGGFLGLAALNVFIYQPLDVLTMLGFFILVGTVVNNAILIVHQSLNHMREDGMNPRDAMCEATGNRIRPIFMTVGTTITGTIPLVLYPGAGSEIYRGVGAVVVGGLLVSTVFTLFIVPAIFSLTLDARAWFTSRLRGWLPAPARPAADDTSAG
jgi:HAE1 family hydrophobic/amphiphilic exporter-1